MLLLNVGHEGFNYFHHKLRSRTSLLCQFQNILFLGFNGILIVIFPLDIFHMLLVELGKFADDLEIIFMWN